MNSNALTDRIIAVFVDGDATALPGLYAPEAVVDVNVPLWRYQLRGADAINAAIRDDELGVPNRMVGSWRTGSTQEGLFLEIEVRFHDGEDRMWRSLHLFRAADGRVMEQTVYCSGIWSAADIARYTPEPSLAEA